MIAVALAAVATLLMIPTVALVLPFFLLCSLLVLGLPFAPMTIAGKDRGGSRHLT